MAKVVETPLMKQYNEIKAQYPDAVLLFRVGDFYETFSEDAIRTSEILGITLTRRANGAAQYVELAGFPHHALDTYLPKLVRHGLRVAICDQLEDPKTCKGLVKRGITELVTPGVSVNDNILDVKENNFLASVYMTKKGVGLSLLDISTGEFLVGEGKADYIEKLIGSFAPKEIIYEADMRSEVIDMVGGKYFLQSMPDWVYTIESARSRLLKHFEVKNLKGFGVDDMELGIVAAGQSHQRCQHQQQRQKFAKFHHPLVPPLETPSMIFLRNTRNSTISGTEMTTTAAIMAGMFSLPKPFSRIS